jgi:hypothetical protein
MEQIVSDNRKKEGFKPINLRKETFNRINKLHVQLMISKEEKQTADSVTNFLLDFYESHKQQA